MSLGFKRSFKAFKAFCLNEKNYSEMNIRENLLTNLRRSESALSAPGIVMVRLDVEPTLYFLTKGLHNLILTKISKIVLANTLTTGEIGGGKKLKFNSKSIQQISQSFSITSREKTMSKHLLLFHFDASEKISNMSN